MNQRGFKWFDEDSSNPVEHSEAQEEVVAELAGRWSQLHYEAEHRGFEMQARMEEGDYGPEPDECPLCHGAQYLGLFSEKTSRYGEPRFPNWCGDHACPNALFGILCPLCGGDGFDHSWERERDKRREKERLELESIEAALTHHGARMMRPYEHWNEDERLMQYMEEGRFGDCSG